jgi:hypothetical protein
MPFLYKMHHFTKTGPGQTWGKHPKKSGISLGLAASATVSVRDLWQEKDIATGVTHRCAMLLAPIVFVAQSFSIVFSSCRTERLFPKPCSGHTRGARLRGRNGLCVFARKKTVIRRRMYRRTACSPSSSARLARASYRTMHTVVSITNR